MVNIGQIPYEWRQRGVAGREQDWESDDLYLSWTSIQQINSWIMSQYFKL